MTCSSATDVELYDVAHLVRGVSYRRSDLVENDQEGVPLLRATNIGDGALAFDEVLYVPRGHVKEVQLLRQFDTVIAMSSGSRKAVGRLAQLRTDWRGCVGAFCGIIRPKEDVIHPSFLGYALRSRDYRVHIDSQAVGTAIMNLSRDRVLSYRFKLPPPNEQRAIAAVLGSLDDKIEQNRRTARALERLARAIFRVWFVDFEPVKAKAEGATSFPSMPQEVFDALPTRFVDSDIGPVPEGWEVTAVSEVFDVNPSRSLRKGEPAPYLDMKSMPTKGHAPESWMERPYGSGMRFMNGDTLVARITPCLENGKTAFVDFLDDGQIAWGSTEYIVLCPKPPLPPIFAYCLARTGEFRDFAVQNMTGTSGRQRVSPSAMEHFRLAVPSKEVAEGFGKVLNPMFECIRSGMEESRKLATMRDYLLPTLLSGEVRVGDIRYEAETDAR